MGKRVKLVRFAEKLTGRMKGDKLIIESYRVAIGEHIGTSLKYAQLAAEKAMNV